MNNQPEFLLAALLLILAAVVGGLVWRFVTRKDQDPSPVPFKASGDRDRLTWIKGIGPTLESRLNGLGITRFKQIAELSSEEIERINGVLNFKGRIEREGWISQARQLMETGIRPPAPRRQTAPRRTAARATSAPILENAQKKVSKKKAPADGKREMPGKKQGHGNSDKKH